MAGRGGPPLVVQGCRIHLNSKAGGDGIKIQGVAALGGSRGIQIRDNQITGGVRGILVIGAVSHTQVVSHVPLLQKLPAAQSASEVQVSGAHD